MPLMILGWYTDKFEVEELDGSSPPVDALG